MSTSSDATIEYEFAQPLIQLPPPLRSSWGPIRLYLEAHISDELECCKWCIDVGLIKPITCSRHRSRRELIKRQDRHPEWWCAGCRDRKSTVDGTIFQDTNLSIGQVLILMFCWAHDYTYEATKSTCIFGAGQTGPCDQTIAHWFSIFRDRIIDWAETVDNQERPNWIGGPGKTVQIDEALIGRRKYNRGRVIEGTWIVGMISDDGQLRLRKCPGNRRNRETLHAMIQRDVAPGSEIHTDGWPAYFGLDEIGYRHRWVNHRENFVNPQDGTHTQRIESAWRALRRKFSPGGRRHCDMEGNLLEYLWLRDCKRKSQDPFASFIVFLSN